MNKKFVILISGPTGTGKSAFVDILPQNIANIEVVNADIGSFYTQLTIGTAKPAWKNSSITHHFFDVINDTSSWTAPQFREKLEILIQEIWSRGNIPVIVGGSAFYIQSFFYKNHTLAMPAPELIKSLELQSSDILWKKLHIIDPTRAAKIDSHDHYRLVRALAIWYTHGKKPSEFTPIFQPLSPFYFVTLTRDRDQLYTMINQRVKIMMRSGWLQEVEQLSYNEQWRDFLFNKKMIGYDLLLEYLEANPENQDLEKTVDLIAQLTRNYAKRQITFLKKLQINVQESMKTVHEYELWPYVVDECNLTLCDLSLYIKQLFKFASSCAKATVGKLDTTDALKK